MLNSMIHVDLPSAETNRRMGPVEWVRSLFGARIDLRSGKEALTVSALSLVEGLVAGFSAAGMSDVISLLVDKKVVYADTNEVADDLPLLLSAAEESGLLDRPFREMHVVLSLREAGLHVLADVTVASEVVMGGEEMAVRLNGRLEELRVHKGESAADYAARVRALAADTEAIEAHRVMFQAITGRIADALRAALVGAKVRVEPARLDVLRPDAPQIARFRQLPFGDDAIDPRYRAVPTTRRSGYYDNPFHYHYYDPYYDYTNWILVTAMLSHHAWSAPWVHVVDPGGMPITTGSDIASGAGDLAGSTGGWGGADAVSFDSSGNLSVDSSIPESSGSLMSEPPASDTAWGGADAASSSDSSWGSSDLSSTDSGSSSWSSDTSSSSCSSSSSSCSSSSSSCGSSCSSSSCGSSS